MATFNYQLQLQLLLPLLQHSRRLPGCQSDLPTCMLVVEEANKMFCSVLLKKLMWWMEWHSLASRDPFMRWEPEMEFELGIKSQLCLWRHYSLQYPELLTHLRSGPSTNKSVAEIVPPLLCGEPAEHYQVWVKVKGRTGRGWSGPSGVSRVFFENISTVNPIMAALGVSFSLRIFFVLFWADLRL